MSIYRYINNSSIDIVSAGYYVPAWGFIQTNAPVMALDSYVGHKLELTINGVKDPSYLKATSFSISAGSNITILVPESKYLEVSATGSSTVSRLDETKQFVESFNVVDSNLSIGPYQGYQEFLVTCTSGSITSEVVDAALVVTTAKIASQISDVGRNSLPSSRYLLRPNSAANPIFDMTPTHFYDPAATTSTGAGTYANPFKTLLEVETYFNGTLNGLAHNKVLGLKRGSVTRGKLELKVTGYSNSSRTSDSPFIIVPYGNSEAAPKIIGAIRVGGNEIPQWTTDGQFWIYDTGLSREVEVFQDGIRIFKKDNRAAALAAGPGYAYWSSNKVYVLPYTNTGNLNATSTLVEVTSAFGALATNAGHTVLVRYKNQARTGNIIIAGIESDKAINSCFSIQSDAFNLPTYVDTLQIIGCIAKNAGVDQLAVGAGSDGIVITGPSDTVRANNVYVGGNYIENCLNNATELNGISSGIVEWNTSIGCGGNSILELYSSCSNVKTRYNMGTGLGSTNKARTADKFKGGGIWVPGYTWDQNNGVDTDASDATKNANNEIYFNVALNNRNEALSLEAGTGYKVYNNTLITEGAINGSPNGSACVMLGTSATSASATTIEYSNNIAVNKGLYNLVLAAGKLSGTERNLTITGNNNVYYNPGSEYAQNSTISTLNSSGGTVSASVQNYTNIESWSAGISAGGATVDANGKMGDPRISETSGKPQLGSFVSTMPAIAPVGYYCDAGGKPLMTSFVGAHQL